MKTILLLHDESRSHKSRLQNAAGSKVTQRPSEGRPAANCDRWGHPLPDRVLKSQVVVLHTRITTSRASEPNEASPMCDFYKARLMELRRSDTKGLN
jgi:hypothetical protein